MKPRKTHRKFFAVWDHRKEIEFLNKQSQKGWQLYRGGAFSTKFEKEEGQIYRYQIDYNPRIANRTEYFGYFQDQDWEYISSTFNGWHYFRKIYDIAKSEDEYEIYTDSLSRAEMNSKIKNIFIPVAIIEGLMFLCNLIMLILRPNLRHLVGTIVFGVLAFFFTRGIFLMDKSFELPVERKRTKMELWIVVIIILAIVMIIFTGIEPN